MDKRTMMLEQLLNSEEAEQVFVEDAEKTLENLAARGINMTLPELAELAAGIAQGLKSPEEGELPESALETVAGGIKIGFWKGFCHGMDDAANNMCGTTRGGPLYQLGYRAGQRIGGCWSL